MKNISKKAGLIVFIIFILNIILLISAFYIKEHKKNKLINDIPSTIEIENQTRYDVDDIAKILAHKILCYDSLHVSIIYMPNIGEVNSPFAGFVTKSKYRDNSYIISLSRNIRISHLKSVLCHEFAHIEQYKSGRLKLLSAIDGLYIYNNDLIDMNVIPYSKRNFEIDAYQREDELYLLLDEIL